MSDDYDEDGEHDNERVRAAFDRLRHDAHAVDTGAALRKFDRANRVRTVRLGILGAAAAVLVVLGGIVMWNSSGEPPDSVTSDQPTTPGGDSPGAGVAESPTVAESSPPTSVEVTDLPDGYVLSARDLFPGDVQGIEAQAAELFGPRLAFIAEASTASQPAIEIFVVRTTPADLDAGAALTTSNVEAVIHPGVASLGDLSDVAMVIYNELAAQGLATNVAVSSAPLEQYITIGVDVSADAATVERVHSVARELIDQESERIAEQRPDTIDVDIPWSTKVLQFATHPVQDPEHPIG